MTSIMKARPVIIVRPRTGTTPANQNTPAQESRASVVPIRDRVRRLEPSPSSEPVAEESLYEVGYRKPPSHTRFRKGASGNPKGRPRGGKNFLTVLKNELFGTIRITEGGRTYVVTKLAALIKARISRSLQGDKRDADRIFTLMEKYFSAEDTAPVNIDVNEQDRRILDRYAERVVALATADRKGGDK
jgi:hypothetical protein